MPFREGKPENYQAIRACCRCIILLILNVNNIFANISLATIFCSRNEGVTVGGLSLAASYMAQVKNGHLSSGFVWRQHLWANIVRPPPFHRCCATSQSMCANTLTLPLGISTADSTSLRFKQTLNRRLMRQNKYRWPQRQSLGNRLVYGISPGGGLWRKIFFTLLQYLCW